MTQHRLRHFLLKKLLFDRISLKCTLNVKMSSAKSTTLDKTEQKGRRWKRGKGKSKGAWDECISRAFGRSPLLSRQNVQMIMAVTRRKLNISHSFAFFLCLSSVYFSECYFTPIFFCLKRTRSYAQCLRMQSDSHVQER